MTEIPGGPSIMENKISYEETKYHMKEIWCGQNEGNLYIHKLEGMSYVVNIELNEIYGILVISNEDSFIYPLSKKYIDILKMNNISYNLWLFPHIKEKIMFDNMPRNKSSIIIICEIIGEKIFYKSDGDFMCYTNQIYYKFDPLDFEYFHIFRIYFDIGSSTKKRNLTDNSELIKYRILTSKYKNIKDGERKRILMIEDPRQRYVIDRSTGKIIGKEEIIKDRSKINPLDDENDIAFVRKLNLL